MVLTPKTIFSGDEAAPFNFIILSTKAYHLEGAIESFRPYVSQETAILPLLNGMLHFDKLAEEFGSERVLGGLCVIETTLDREGKIIQTGPAHDLVNFLKNCYAVQHLLNN